MPVYFHRTVPWKALRLSRLHSHTDISKPHGLFLPGPNISCEMDCRGGCLLGVYSVTLTNQRFPEAQNMSDLITELQECFLRINGTNVIFVSEVPQILQA